MLHGLNSPAVAGSTPNRFRTTFIHPFIHPSIHQSILIHPLHDSSIYPSIHTSIHPSIHPSICLPIVLVPVCRSIHPSIYLSVCLSVSPSIDISLRRPQPYPGPRGFLNNPPRGEVRAASAPSGETYKRFTLLDYGGGIYHSMS